jgi:putative ABC transport system permease protein
MVRRLYALLLRSYPAAFRRRFGNELRFAFEAGWRSASRRGARAAVSFLAASAADAVVNGIRERRSPRVHPPYVSRPAIMTTVIADLRFGVRLLKRQPGLATLAVSTLALGIGLAVGLFTVAYGALLRPLPYRDEPRVVMMYEFAPAKDVLKGSATPGNFLDWRGRSRAFSHVGALAPFTATLATSGEPVRAKGRRVTADVFGALGVDPLLGRLFTTEDEAPGNGVAVLSHRTWTRHFAADPTLIGRSVLVNEARRIVVGVLKPDFRLPGGNDEVLVPWTFNAFERQARRSHYASVVARIKEDVTFAQAQADIASVAAQLEKEFPDANAGESVVLEPIRRAIVGDLRPALLMLTGAVTLVLLIACVNVANLLLTRALGRRDEMAVRLALGASRARLARQLLTESLLMSTIAGALGLVLAIWCVRTLALMLPASFDTVVSLRLDPVVTAAAVALCAGTGLVFGVAPALFVLRRDAGSASQGNRLTTSRSAARVRRVLVTVQVALAIVLLTGAGLLMRSFARLVDVAPGFRPDHLLTLKMELPPSRYRGPAQWTPFFDRLLEELRTIPDVRDAAGIGGLPVSSPGGSNAIFVEGRRLPLPNQSTFAVYRLVTPGYFSTIGIPVVDGRDFSAGDRAGAPRVGAVNQLLASRMWPGERAIGKRLTFARAPKPEDWITIVAVVGDTHHDSLAGPIDLQLYAPYTQDPHWFPPAELVVRTGGVPTAIAPAVRRRIRDIDPLIPVTDVQSMEALVARSVAEPRFHLVLLAALSASALALAMIGLYGLLAYSVVLRAREIGVRSALGATRGDIAAMILGDGLRLTATGVVLGVAAALALTRSLRTLLFQIEPHDPATFAVIAVMLLAVAAAACYPPARRAARVDPVVILKTE